MYVCVCVCVCVAIFLVYQISLWSHSIEIAWAGHIACVPRLWQRQSFQRTLLMLLSQQPKPEGLSPRMFMRVRSTRGLPLVLMPLSFSALAWAMVRTGNWCNHHQVR